MARRFVQSLSETLSKKDTTSLLIGAPLLILGVHLVSGVVGYVSRSRRAAHLARVARDKRRSRDEKRKTYRPLIDAVLPEEDVRARILALSSREILAAYRSGTYTPTQVVATYCDRAMRAGEAFECTADEPFEEALKAAALSTQRYQAGTARPLEGLPYSVKDCINQRGLDATAGLAVRCFKPCDEDAVVVSILRQDGGIPFVRTNIPQSLLLPESSCAHWGTTQNPYSRDRTAGGSSGGEASLIAAGGSPLGIGSDIGGSLRIPAHFCGITCLKPTPRRMSRHGMVACRTTPTTGQEHIIPTCGPMGRCVGDVTLMMESWVNQRMWDADIHSLPIPWDAAAADASAPVTDLTIGYYETDGFFDPAEPCKRAVREAVAALEARGVKCIRFDPPNVEEAVSLMYGLLTSDGNVGLFSGMEGEEVNIRYRKLRAASGLPGFIRPALAALLELIGQQRPAILARHAKAKSAADLWHYVRLKDEYIRKFTKQWREAGVDAVISPGLTTPAWLHKATADLTPACCYSFLYNVLHYPAGIVPVTTVRPEEQVYNPPAGQHDMFSSVIRKNMKTAAGTPVGVQVAALPWKDEMVCRVMGVLEEALGGSRYNMADIPTETLRFD